MAHGFGCTRDSGLLPFAQRFATAGWDVKAARRMPAAEVLAFDCAHFAIYLGDVFERSVAAQAEFLRRTLRPCS